MATTVLLALGLIAADPTPAGPGDGDRAAYDAARAAVGRDPEAHLKLALWCEAHGLQPERVKHLALAVLADPRNATARGLMGLVAYGGQWKRPEAVAEKVKADEALTARLAEYNARRARAPETADAQWALGLWCEQNGLAAEALAHFTAVTRLDPSREAAWKRLGCKKVNGRWVSEAQLAAEKAEAEALKKADKHWKPLLTKWRGWLGDRSKRGAAEEALAMVSDPRAVGAVWSVFVAGGSAHHGRAVQLFGQIDTAGSSRALAMLAAFDDSAEVRRAAVETLKRRDPREFAGMLVALLRDPIKYEVRPVGGPGSPGALFVAGERFNVQRLYAPPALPNILARPGDTLTTDLYGLPVIERLLTTSSSDRIIAHQIPEAQAVGMVRAQYGGPAQVPAPLSNLVPNVSQVAQQINATNAATGARLEQQAHQQAQLNGGKVNVHSSVTTQTRFTIPVGQMVLEAQNAAASAEMQLESDVAVLDAFNKQTRALNDRAALALNAISGQDLASDPSAWRSWWVNQLGYRSDLTPQSGPVPTLVENVPLGYIPQARPSVSVSQTIGPLTSIRAVSCFGAGTLVRTLDGSRPIESIQVGDRVLTQDVKTGALGYQPVTVVHHNPPSPTFLVRVGGDTIVSSPFHRFWVAGRGWVMARDLKGGETLRLLDGSVRVGSVEAGPVQPVFNLDVTEAHDFFAGSAAALVHDNTLPDTRLAPFDAPPELASASGAPAR
jgi:hypothetical protein